MYYEGDLVNRTTISRNMGWTAISSIVLNGSIYVGTTTPNSGATFDVGETSTSTFYTFLNGLRISGRDISIYHNVVNSPLTFHTNWSSTTNDYISFCTRTAARLTIDGGGVITCNSDSFNFPNTLNQYKINLYGTNTTTSLIVMVLVLLEAHQCILVKVYIIFILVVLMQIHFQ